MFILAKRNKMKITFISDTHTKHHQVTSQLPGGDLLIHAGDIMNSGYRRSEVTEFCGWFEWQDYDNCVFIAGNHDRLFEDEPDYVKTVLSEYGGIDYLEDESLVLDNGVKIWGSPWQPEFYDWAFNLPKDGLELKQKWSQIPIGTDILITHGPPHGHLDAVVGQYNNLGCKMLSERIEVVKPKIHVFGHIHSGYGYKFENGTHYINASVLGEDYIFKNKPLTVEWDPDTNEIKFLN